MKKITLTFDNGPHPEVTPRVLDALRQRGLRAHFYALGKHLATEEGGRLARRAIAEGHLVANHSFSHEVPLGDDPRWDAVEREILTTQALLDALFLESSPLPVPHPAPHFRPFGGGGLIGPHLLSQRAADYLVAHRYTCVLWNAVPRDWEDPQGWPERALEQCARLDHSVLVLHDVPGACADRLPELLDLALQRDFAFVSELPASCTPLVGGTIVGDLGSIIRPAGAVAP